MENLVVSLEFVPGSYISGILPLKGDLVSESLGILGGNVSGEAPSEHAKSGQLRVVTHNFTCFIAIRSLFYPQVLIDPETAQTPAEGGKFLKQTHAGGE